MVFRILSFFFVSVWLLSIISDVQCSTCTSWTNNATEDCYILASCSTSGLAITIKGVDFPNTSPASGAYISSSTTPSYVSDCAFNLTTADTEHVELFAPTLTNCYTDTSAAGTQLGLMYTYLYLRYLGVTVTSQKDITVTIQCEFKHLDDYGNITTTAATTDFTPKTLGMSPIVVGVGWQNVIMEFLYEDETVITFGNSLQINKDTQDMCVRIKASDTDIEDFLIEDFTISENADPSLTTNKIEIIQNGCTDASYNDFFEFPALATSGTCTGTFKEQCKNSKMFCFKPFKFADSNNMNYIASLKRLNGSTTTPAAGALKTCSANELGMGKKKRDTGEEQEDDTAEIIAALTIYNEDDVERRTVFEEAACNTYEYMLIVFALSGSAIFLLIIDLFLCIIKIKKSDK